MRTSSSTPASCQRQNACATADSGFQCTPRTVVVTLPHRRIGFAVADEKTFREQALDDGVRNASGERVALDPVGVAEAAERRHFGFVELDLVARVRRERDDPYACARRLRAGEEACDVELELFARLDHDDAAAPDSAWNVSSSPILPHRSSYTLAHGCGPLPAPSFVIHTPGSIA